MNNEFDMQKFFEEFNIKEEERKKANEEARRRCSKNCTYYDEDDMFACTRCGSL